MPKTRVAATQIAVRIVLSARKGTPNAPRMIGSSPASIAHNAQRPWPWKHSHQNEQPAAPRLNGSPEGAGGPSFRFGQTSSRTGPTAKTKMHEPTREKQAATRNAR